MTIMKHIIIAIFTCISSLSLSAKKAVIILGPPGSGKGTQTVLLRDALDLPLISSANILREERIRNSNLAKVRDANKDDVDISNFMRLGVITKKLVEIHHNISRNKAVILDSWPKVPSALSLAKEAFFNDDPPLVIELVVEKNELLTRVAGRIVCINSQCGRSYGAMDLLNSPECKFCGAQLMQRPNDNWEYFSLRVDRFFNIRKDYLHEYEKHGFKIHAINGNRDKQAIHDDIIALVKRYLAS